MSAFLAGSDLLQCTLDFLTEHPERHDQGVWIQDVVGALAENGPVTKTEDVTKVVAAEDNVCGTAGCVAGWGSLFAGYHQLRGTWTEYVVDENGDVKLMQDAAQEAFGLTVEQANVLFAGTNTIDEVREYITTLIDDPTAILGMQYIDYYDAEDMFREYLNDQGIRANGENVSASVFYINGTPYSPAEVVEMCDGEDSWNDQVRRHAKDKGYTVD